MFYDVLTYDVYLLERFTFLVMDDNSYPQGRFHLVISTSCIIPLCCQGLGVHPHEDPWGVPFSESYCRDRWLRAGSRLCGPYTFALDGIQGDADFVAALFQLNRP